MKVSKFFWQRIFFATNVFIFAYSHFVFANLSEGGLKASVALDLTGDYKLSKNSDSEDRFSVRGAEMSFYAPIDHHSQGVLSLAAHEESGNARFEVHEAFFQFDSLLPRSSLTVGQFFLDIGRLNNWHQHDWPFITPPEVHKTFFAQEGVLDKGVQLSSLLPTPFYLNLTTGLTSGFNFGHSHGPGEKPKVPTHYLHLTSFFSLGSLDVQPGLTYLSRTDSQDEKTYFLGTDWTAKIKKGRQTDFLFQSELWYKNTSQKGVDKEQQKLGLYLYPQIGFASNFELGLRYDYLADLNLKDANENDYTRSHQALVPTLSYKPSEFSTFRIAYTAEFKSEGDDSTVEHSIQFQGIYILGSHPSHSF